MDESPVVTLEFTQEMEGDFRVELTYERILDEGEAVALDPVHAGIYLKEQAAEQ